MKYAQVEKFQIADAVEKLGNVGRVVRKKLMFQISCRAYYEFEMNQNHVPCRCLYKPNDGAPNGFNATEFQGRRNISGIKSKSTSKFVSEKI